MRVRLIVLGFVLVMGACADDGSGPIFTSTTGDLGSTTVAPATTAAPPAAPPATPAVTAATIANPPPTASPAPAATAAPAPTLTELPECLGGGPPRPSSSGPGVGSAAYGDFDGDGVIAGVVWEEILVTQAGDEWFLWLTTSYGYSTEISLGMEETGGEGNPRGNMRAIASAYLGFSRELIIVRTETAPAAWPEQTGLYEFFAFDGCSLINTGTAYNVREFPPQVGEYVEGLATFTCHDDGTVLHRERTSPEGGGYRHRAWAFEYDPSTTSWTGLGEVLNVVTADSFIDITGSASPRVHYIAEEDIAYSCN